MSDYVTCDPIFKVDTTQRVRQWSYDVDADNGRWRTTAGLFDGKKVTSEWTACVARSQDTPGNQALFEANADRDKKLARGYYNTIDEARAHVNSIEPMLAHKYGDRQLVFSQLWSQPKLDGMRCIGTQDVLYSRQGKEIASCPHILRDIERFVETTGYFTDGEIYNHDLKNDFNKIMSLARKKKVTADDLAESEQMLQYHVYDIIAPELTYQQRLEVILANSHLFGKSVVVVETALLNSQEDVDILYDSYLVDNYEGQMIRFNDKYEHKRSKSLLKRKPFQTEEYTIECLVDEIIEGNGNWSGAAKSAWLRDNEGRRFKASIPGSREGNAMLLGSKDKYEGTVVTVKFLNLTPDGIPRVGQIIDWHGKERVD